MLISKQNKFAKIWSNTYKNPFELSLSLLTVLLLSGCAAQTDFERGTAIKDENPDKAKQLMLKGIEHIKPSYDQKAVADMYDKYANLCADQDDWKTAKEYFDKAISTSENSKSYYEMALHCHNAAWAEHERFRQDHSYKPGLIYAKRAVQAADKSYGVDKTDFFLWTLGQIYIDRGEIPQAKECLDRALAILQKTNSKPTDYALTTLARLYAYEHQWDKSLETILQANALSKGDSTNSTTNDYFVALSDANPEKNKTDFSQAQLALAACNFDKLDALANQIRTHKENLADGEWRIDKLYDALALPSDSSEDKWQPYLNKLRAWTEHNPKSITAKIALAKAYVRYAWKARGSSWANKVKDSAWKKMNDRLALADAQLQLASKLSTDCPCLYTTWTNVALGQDWEMKKYNSLLDKCAKEFPTYITVKMSKAYYLQPRWNGQPGEWEAYAKDVAAKEPSAISDTTYAQIVWSIDRRRMYDNIFSDNPKLEWPQVKRGMQKIIDDHPGDTAVRAEYIKLALQAKDDQALKDTFKTPVK